MTRYYPSEKEFLKLAKKGNLIPVYKEMTVGEHTPASAFKKIDKGKYSYLLESIEGTKKIAQYSFLGSKPSLVFTTKGKKAKIIKNNRITRSFVMKQDPLSEIKKIMSHYKYVPVRGVPRFCGGLVGFLGYDVVRFFEKLPDKNPDTLKMPDCVFALTDTLIVFDHSTKKIKIVNNVFIKNGNPGNSYKSAIKKIEKLASRLQSEKCPAKKTEHIKKKIKISSNLTKKQFEKMVVKAKRYIRQGDIVQTVLSQRLKMPLKSDAFNVYRVLRSINPSPYMYYLKFGNLKIVGSSPEIMVRCEKKTAELRPIAGTRPRGKNSRQDKTLEKQLLRDPKERAEHVMLVDLGRNDVGRVCDYGSVAVSEFMRIEKYSHVMHIVSDVTGKVSKGKDQYDLLRATFPAGTVTGAPKIRAMEIIDELENTKRGPYSGAIGYFSFSGNIDTCITIRTIVIKDNQAFIQAGAGIVADSIPAREYQETLNKAKGMIKAIEIAQKGIK